MLEQRLGFDSNDYVQSAAPACNPQRPGTPAGAGRAYLT
eukprot:COSAG01_NODE_73688_length_239_cov_2.978571_1_plen_38_part_10